MDRKQAESIVADKTQVRGGCRCVSREDALLILGDEILGLLDSDAIRRIGPEPGFIYAWNVIDYLAAENPAMLCNSKIHKCPDFIARHECEKIKAKEVTGQAD
jgi:hypothetical protein